jgi:hypothetical protein
MWCDKNDHGMGSEFCDNVNYKAHENRERLATERCDPPIYQVTEDCNYGGDCQTS